MTAALPPAPGAGASQDEIAEFVRAVRAAPQARDALVPLLCERAGIYAGKGTGEVERLRGFILASFGETGLPDAALPFALEELETGRDPYAVAAAARALGAAERVPREAARLIEGAMHRLRHGDEPVDFATPAPAAGGGGRTALAELAAALERARASPCCRSEAPAAPRPTAGPAPAAVGAIELEDQDGTRLRFAELVAGRAALVSFFYTRCTNPLKCSQTVSKLARVGELAAAAGLGGRVVAAGISYDPAFDRPARLRAYGAARRMRFGAHCRLLRTAGPFEPLRDALALGVGYGEATVNRHRLEAILLDPRGEVAEVQARRAWDEDAMFARLAALAGAGPPAARR